MPIPYGPGVELRVAKGHELRLAKAQRRELGAASLEVELPEERLVPRSGNP